MIEILQVFVSHCLFFYLHFKSEVLYFYCVLLVFLFEMHWCSADNRCMTSKDCDRSRGTLS